MEAVISSMVSIMLDMLLWLFFEILEQEALSLNTSAEKPEVVALKHALQLAKDKMNNIFFWQQTSILGGIGLLKQVPISLFLIYMPIDIILGYTHFIIHPLYIHYIISIYPLYNSYNSNSYYVINSFKQTTDCSGIEIWMNKYIWYSPEILE